MNKKTKDLCIGVYKKISRYYINNPWVRIASFISAVILTVLTMYNTLNIGKSKILIAVIAMAWFPFVFPHLNTEDGTLEKILLSGILSFTIGVLIWNNWKQILKLNFWLFNLLLCFLISFAVFLFCYFMNLSIKAIKKNVVLGKWQQKIEITLKISALISGVLSIAINMKNF